MPINDAMCKNNDAMLAKNDALCKKNGAICQKMTQYVKKKDEMLAKNDAMLPKKNISTFKTATASFGRNRSAIFLHRQLCKKLCKNLSVAKFHTFLSMVET